jgi:hypothetical protein
MSAADEFGLLGELMWAHLSSSLITLVALRRDAAMRTSSSTKMRVFASLPGLGMNFGLRLAASARRYSIRRADPDCAPALDVANRY